MWDFDQVATTSEMRSAEHRRHQATAPKDDVHEGSARPAVAVDEG